MSYIHADLSGFFGTNSFAIGFNLDLNLEACSGLRWKDAGVRKAGEAVGSDVSMATATVCSSTRAFSLALAFSISIFRANSSSAAFNSCSLFSIFFSTRSSATRALSLAIVEALDDSERLDDLELLDDLEALDDWEALDDLEALDD